jgi:hypothetical protein
MKRILSSVFIAVLILVGSSASADPITHPVDFICPNASSLGHFGTYIAGTGSEVLSSRTTNPIHFESRSLLIGVPHSLANYSNSDTHYDGPSGYVSCSFTSSRFYENGFRILYKIRNGKGGQILSKNSNTIRVLFFVGLGK